MISGACASSGTIGSSCKEDLTRTSTDSCSSCRISLLISSATVKWTSTSTRPALTVRGVVMLAREVRARPRLLVVSGSDHLLCSKLWDLSTKPFRERKVKQTILFCLKIKIFLGMVIGGSRWTGIRIHQENGLCKASLIWMPVKSGDCTHNVPRTSWRVSSNNAQSLGSCCSRSPSSQMVILTRLSRMKRLKIQRVQLSKHSSTFIRWNLPFATNCSKSPNNDNLSTSRTSASTLICLESCCLLWIKRGTSWVIAQQWVINTRFCNSDRACQRHSSRRSWRWSGSQ